MEIEDKINYINKGRAPGLDVLCGDDALIRKVCKQHTRIMRSKKKNTRGQQKSKY